MNELTPRALQLSDAAKQLWIQFHDHVEVRCGPDQELADVKDYAAKVAEQAARIAGILTLIEDLYAEEIGLEAMTGAVALMDWYLGEIDKTEAAGRISQELMRAQRLLTWLQDRPDGTATFREIQQFGPTPRTKADVEKKLEILKDHGWIRETSQSPRMIKAVRL